MRTYSIERINCLLACAILVPALVGCGIAMAEQTEPAVDSTQEVRDRFDTFEGSVRQIPSEQWEDYFLDVSFSLAYQDGKLEVGSEQFHDRVKGFLDSPESEGLSLDFELHEVWTVASRLALVRGDVQAKVGRGGPVRPFAELLVKKDGDWRTVASYVGSPEERGGVADGVQGGTSCACEPCRTCSRRR